MSLTNHSQFLRVVRVAVLCVTLTVFSLGNVTHAATVAAPEFTSPKYGEMQLDAAHVLAGSIETGSAVTLHIDSEKAGLVQAVFSEDARAAFSFVPIEPLAPGYHTLEAFASDPREQKYSSQSLWWWFHVADPLPAPVILMTRERAGSAFTVAGVVKSGHKVRVYVDDTALLTSEVFVHASGTQSFALTLPALSLGSHRIAVTAVREDGQESARSEISEVEITGQIAEAKPPVTEPTPSVAPSGEQASVLAPGVSEPAMEEELESGTVISAPLPSFEEGVRDEVPSETKPEVIILPPAEATETGVMSEEASDETAPAGQSRGQRTALIILGILLVALIIWYATRKDEGSQQEGAPLPEVKPPHTTPPSPLPFQEYSSPPREAKEPPRTEGDQEENIPPPPPPPPSFAARMDY